MSMIFKWVKHNFLHELDNTVFEAGGPQKITHVTMDLNMVIYSAGIGDLEAGLKSALIKQLQLMQERLSRHERVDSCSALQFKPREIGHLLTVIQTVGSIFIPSPLFFASHHYLMIDIVQGHSDKASLDCHSDGRFDLDFLSNFLSLNYYNMMDLL